jgi:hypothetical protein
MIRLFNFFVDVCLLRKGPQDLSASSVLLGFCILVHFLVGVGGELLLSTEPTEAIAWSALSITIVITATAAALSLFGLGTRLQQVLATYLGAEALLNFVFLPLSLALVHASTADQAANPLISLTWLVLFFWGFAIDGHIFRNAFSRSFPAGVLIAALLFSIRYGIHKTLFEAVA